MMKLSKECKALRLGWISAIGCGTLAMNADGITVLHVPGESADMICTAVASEDDRGEGVSRKVGEFYALQRYMEGDAIPLPAGLHDSAADVLYALNPGCGVVSLNSTGDVNRYL